MCQVILSLSCVSGVNPLVAFYDIHERKGQVLFYSSILETTRDIIIFENGKHVTTSSKWPHIRINYFLGEISYTGQLIVRANEICIHVYGRRKWIQFLKKVS
jgi:hypothetical protein